MRVTLGSRILSKKSIDEIAKREIEQSSSSKFHSLLAWNYSNEINNILKSYSNATHRVGICWPEKGDFDGCIALSTYLSGRFGHSVDVLVRNSDEYPNCEDKQNDLVSIMNFEDAKNDYTFLILQYSPSVGESFFDMISKNTKSKRIALEGPCGLNLDHGEENQIPLKVDFTITSIAPSMGVYSNKGKEYSGEVRSLDLLPFEQDIRNSMYLELSPNPRPLTPRQQFAHKGTAGHVLIIAGNENMGGAAVLCGESCSNAGAGKITLLTHSKWHPSIITRDPNLMVDSLDVLLSKATEVLEAARLKSSHCENANKDGSRQSGTTSTTKKPSSIVDTLVAELHSLHSVGKMDYFSAVLPIFQSLSNLVKKKGITTIAIGPGLGRTSESVLLLLAVCILVNGTSSNSSIESEFSGSGMTHIDLVIDADAIVCASVLFDLGVVKRFDEPVDIEKRSFTPETKEDISFDVDNPDFLSTSEHKEWSKGVGKRIPRVVFTPHEGEALFLLNRSAPIKTNLHRLPQYFVMRYGGSFLLKGARSITCERFPIVSSHEDASSDTKNSSSFYFNSICNFGNPYMGTGGSGDVLTGLIAAVLAQTRGARSPFLKVASEPEEEMLEHSVQLLYPDESMDYYLLRDIISIHAMAGDVAMKEGGIGLNAQDIAKNVKVVLNHLK